MHAKCSIFLTLFVLLSQTWTERLTEKIIVAAGTVVAERNKNYGQRVQRSLSSEVAGFDAGGVKLARKVRSANRCTEPLTYLLVQYSS